MLPGTNFLEKNNTYYEKPFWHVITDMFDVISTDDNRPA